MTLTEPIVVRFIPTPRDFARASFAHMWRRLWPLLILVVILLITFMVVRVSALISLLSSQEVDFRSPVMGCALLAILLPIAVVAGVFSSPLLIARRVSRQPMLQTETTYEFGEDAIIVRDAHSELRHDWASYSKVVVTKDLYLLVFTVNKGVVRFIPRRAFESPEQENAFRELLARKLNFKG